MRRWPSRFRLTVEECKSVSTKFLKDHGYLNSRVRSGELCYTIRGRVIGRIGIRVEMPGEEEQNMPPTMYLWYRADGKNEKLHRSGLVSTPCFFGGRRWWFVCPECHRRIGILYLVGTDLGCRLCHDLTYRSCRESHMYDALWKKLGIDPKDAKGIF